jgi:hypothetical protein
MMVKIILSHGRLIFEHDMTAGDVVEILVALEE